VWGWNAFCDRRVEGYGPVTERGAFTQLVVIGSSAGGIEALSTLVSTLPNDFPAPIVLGQHLSPSRRSHLAEILARRSTLPIREVGDREPLEPGVIFVVPANRHVEISDHEVRVRPDAGGGSMPSIDLLFKSAADVFGEDLVAVILTGSGSDGADGARYVKQAGGTVVVQNPQTATYPGMPLSLAPTTVDVVSNLESIGPLLNDLLVGAYVATPAEEEDPLRAFLEHLRELTGIDFNSYKLPTVRRRLRHRMVATGTEDLATYIRYLQRNPDEYQRLVATFLIKVTEFFRDDELFSHLREQVMPELLARARDHGNELRIWSAGCATGEEAYSLAILISEILGDELDRYNVRIFATDLDADAVAYARRGIYPPAALAALPRELVERYFTPTEGAYEIKKRARTMVIFGQHDLAQRAPFPRTDLALCRNVLIYFTSELQRRALQLFAYSLRDGGYLVLGKAETTSPLGECFALEHPRLRIYRRVGDRVLIPAVRLDRRASGLPSRLPANRPITTGMDLMLARARRESQHLRSPGEKAENLLLRLPVGVVVIDRRYDIQLINGAARRLLGIHGPAIGEDFIHLAERIPSAALRADVDAALQGESRSNIHEVRMAEAESGGRLYVQVAVSRLDGETDGEPNAALIVVTDVTEMIGERRAVEEAAARHEAELAQLRAQVERLADTNRRLLEANRDLTGVNAELRSANEELLVANEEVQAATEEVETLNEEMQATNEELETLNEELQATVEELNTTNDDLEARSADLQELAASVEAQRRISEEERARLQAILVSMGDAVLVVDRSGEPVLTNAAYERMFGGPNADFVPRDESGLPLPPEATPRRRAAAGEPFTMSFTLIKEDGSRCWFEANGHPIRPDGQPQGSVVVIRDITDRSLRRLQDEFLALASHELRTPLTALDGYLQMLLRELCRAGEPDDAPTRRYATTALNQARQLGRLSRDLLDVGRLQSGRLRLALETVDLVPLVRQTVELARSLARGQAIALDADDGPLPVRGDPGRLEQVLLNLLTNAIQYAPDTERIDVRLRRDGPWAAIEVQDYGPGIAAADLPHVFTRFYRAQPGARRGGGGLGLGLFISRELVAAHGGTLEVASTVGQGATFTVCLPLAESDP
jgi:two-component system, chemotaxis family, CheB/CheR fusion protein